MKLLSRIALLAIPLPCLLPAQSWEVSGSAGYGVFHNVNVNNSSASGTAGFDSGVVFGAALTNRVSRWVSGEARYTYNSDDLKVTSGSVTAKASAASHAIHYDVLIHATSAESRIRPFLAAGAGVKLYRGTGAEPAYQPLGNLVVLTHTNEAQPLVSVGGGVKFLISRRAILRFDVRDYATPVPTSLLATPPNSRTGGWIHDLAFMVGVGAGF